MPLLEVTDVGLSFGGIKALDGPSFTVDAGTVCGLIGPNGAGKTTMFNCISGVYSPDRGSVRLNGQELLSLAPHRIPHVGIARTFQNLGLFPSLTVLQNVMMGAYAKSSSGYVAAALRLPHVRRREREAVDRAWAALEYLGLAQHADDLATGLPFGTLKRIEIARALLTEPELLLLDEPASGLTHAEVDQLASVVSRIRDDHGMTVLLVEHHMAMVMSISDKVVVLESGRLLACGTPNEVQTHPEVQKAYLGGAA